MDWTKIIFFGIFYVVLGTAGISIPAILNGVVLNEISIGLVTIVVSTVGYASAEKLLQLYDNKTTKLEVVINISMMVIFLFSTIVVAICISQNKNQCITLWISIISYLISCALWWYQNRSNDNFNEDSAETLGGNSNKF